jgi:ADP-ribose pyrophosphatase
MSSQTPHVIKDYVTEKDVPICLHENRFFRMMFNGRFHYLDAVKYGRGVVIVPRFANGDLLLVQLRRAPAIGLSWEFPRGGLDEGETVQQGAARELLEETGYAVEPESLRFLGRVGPDTATINGLMDVYQVDIADNVAAGTFDTEEIERPVRMCEQEFAGHVIGGDIVDGMSLAAYTLLKLRG